jgi:aldose sugar dehydrogenase
VKTPAIILAGILVCSGCARDAGAPTGASAAAARVDRDASPLSEPEVILGNLDTVWGIDFLPASQMIFTERAGRVSILEANGERRTIATLSVRKGGEGGLHGVAVDPDFERSRHVFLYYTHQTANRVSRFTLGEDLSLRDETTILDDIPRARFHNGGRIRFGPDGMLYITTGDALQERLSQDRNSLAGKILRIRKNGSLPEDNPFGNAVWAYGLRNPQGIDWHPETRELYASDHGPSRRDAVYRIERGGNYGWPQTCDRTGNFRPSLRCYTEFTLAPCGVAFSGNHLLVTGLRGNQLRRLAIEGTQVVHEEQLLTELGRLREVVVHEGWVYVGTSNRDGRGSPGRADDRILRFRLS